jgi:indolepyruvate decarboxylase
MTAQEISTLLRHGLKPIVFVVNNRGYTIERKIYGPHSSYNDLQNWSYRALPSVFGPESCARSYSVSTLGELDATLATVSASSCFSLVELHMDPMDAPASLERLAMRAAEFDYGV